MNTQQCPVCDGKAMCLIRRVSDPVTVIPSPLSLSCEQCGNFTAVEGFFPYEWAEIPPEDRPAIAVYLRETKGNSNYPRELSPQSWRHMAHLGREWRIA
jgi:hypothetical protein